MMEISYLREPTEEEIKRTLKWSGTTERIFEVIRSGGKISTAALQQLTGYQLNTVHAQLSILDRMGLIEKVRSVVSVAKTNTKTVRAKLIENVQFIYELALAELELDAFDVKYAVANSLREFVLARESNIEVLVNRLAYFKTLGDRMTDYYRLTRYNRTSSVNQYLTHWIYPYKGKFHPQMIRALMNILGLQQNETVLDPFIGSGTTAVEAQLLGINCIGVDVSPLSVLQSKVKTESMAVIESVKRTRDESVSSFSSSTDINALLQEQPAKRYERFMETIDDERVKNFYNMARLVAISDNARRGRNMAKSFVKNLDMMIESVEDYVAVSRELNLKLGKADIQPGDSRSLELPDEMVDGIITSPPYSIALDYVANDAHAFRAMGRDIESMRDDFIGVRGRGEAKIKLYNEDIVNSYAEMHRVLKRGRYCAIVVGDATYLGTKVKTIDFTIKQCESLGFTLVKNINKIIYGLYNVMQTDNTLIFRKDG